jgi:Ser/Thr protein kinase RdoA (MazF antagonist)
MQQPASRLITAGDQVTAAWLTDTLRANGTLPRGQVTEVQLKPRLFASSLIIPLELLYSTDAPATAPKHLILKISKVRSDIDRPKEIEFYTSIALTASDLPVIKCYDAAYAPELRQFHLLLEDLSDTHFSHPPSQIPPRKIYCEQIVDALAQLHAFGWGTAHREQHLRQLPLEEIANSQTAIELGQWAAQTLPAFADFLGDRLSNERLKILEHACAALPARLSIRLADTESLALIHGDVHIGNFLYPHQPDRSSVRILDWKSWSIDIGADDLAHMMTVFWFPERRSLLEHDLVQRYHRRLIEYGITGYDWQACWSDYRLSAIRYLFYPMSQWQHTVPIDIWWNHLERVMLAFQDLHCAELL